MSDKFSKTTLELMDHHTVQTIKHLLAGRLKNIRGSAVKLEDSRYKDLISRDSLYITELLVEMEEALSNK
jgi:acyl carrier protein